MCNNKIQSEDIKNLVSMQDVIDYYGLKLDKNGFCYCPFHLDKKSPSMRINIKKNIAHCFGGCGETFDVIKFVQKMQKCSFQEALEFMNDVFNCKLGDYELSKFEKEKIKMKIESNKRHKRNKIIFEKFKQRLHNYLISEIKSCEIIIEETSIKHGEFRNNWSNEKSDIYFWALKRLNTLDWFYRKVNEAYTPENEYDYLYGSDTKTILRKIYMNKINLDEV